MGRAFEFRKARKMKRWSAMAKAFTRIGKDIVMAVKEGGPDPDTNAKLRAVIQNAKSVNMPKDNIERAIKRASDKNQGDYKVVLFEGYAPHGIAVLVETATDNNNRTVAEVRHAFTKAGGNLGTDGSVSYLFIKKGLIQIRSNSNLELAMETAIEAGAEDIEESVDQSTTIFTLPENFESVKDSLLKAEIDIENSEVSLIPEISVSTDLETSIKIFKLLEILEDLDDTQNVHSNADFPKEIIEHLD